MFRPKGGPGPVERVRPSPNIWNWPAIYEVENRAQDSTGAIWRSLREQRDWAGLDVLDLGCGDGFHLPLFAATARTVVGIEPHPPLVRRARRRMSHLSAARACAVRVGRASAERLPLETASVDLLHARTAYFFGPGCEPGLAEAERVLRPTGTMAIVDLDATASPYGDWMLADLPDYDPVVVEPFFADRGFDTLGVNTLWRFTDRESLESVLRIEFSPATARRAMAETPGLTIPVRYRLRIRHNIPN